MTESANTDTAGGPDFLALVSDLRLLVKRQQDATIAKAEAARRNASAVMAKAAEAFAHGRITAHDLTRLHAIRLRLDAALPERDRT